MGAHTQTFRNALPTAATFLARIGRWHCYDATPSTRCLGFEDTTELCPARVRYRFGQAVIPHHVGNLQVFEIDGVVVSE